MINKEQILVVPVNYTSYIKNGFTGASSISTARSYSLYDSTGVYEPIYKIENNICFIKISVMLLFKQDNKFLVKELYDTTKRPCLEIGVNSYIKPVSGHYNAIYNQINRMLQYDLSIDPDTVKINFIGFIRDLTNNSVKSTLGCIYYIDTTGFTIQSNSDIYQYKWYTLTELIDRYSKSTSWSKKITDCLIEKTIKIN